MFKLSILLSLFFAVSFAQAAQNAVVTTEGAIVYRNNNFDAPILGYFSAGKKVRISNKTYGAFYRVGFKQGKIGYISDIDLQVEGKTFQPRGSLAQKNLAEKRRPYLGGKFFGLRFENINYADTVGAFNGSSTTSFIGGALSFPMATFFDGAFTVAMNGLYSLQTPELYTALSSSDPSGFVIIGDIQLLYGMMSLLGRKLDIYLGAGVTAGYTDIVVTQSNSEVPISSASIGGIFSIGMAYQFSSFAVKFEPRYYVEEDSYLGLGFAFMRSF